MLNVRCRVKFLLESLTAIKNNNVHKLLDVEQQQQLIRLQKLLKTFTRGHTRASAGLCMFVAVSGKVNDKAWTLTVALLWSRGCDVLKT